MSALLANSNLLMIFAVLGLAPADEQTARDEGAQRLQFMKDSVTTYEFTLEGQRSAVHLQAEPAFRLGSQGNGVLEGAIFFWNDGLDRPEAAAQVFLHRRDGAPGGIWLHEFTSLSPAPFIAEQKGRVCWTPKTAGVEFRPIPDAPKPAATLTQRARQMRNLAQDFKAQDDFGQKGWIDLRMLATPIARYGKADSRLLDGALFAFVVGTDPEVFLFIEARPGDDGPQWKYALAPMTCWPVRASWKSEHVWGLPMRSTDDSTKPFFARAYQP
jgi:hypothetical protein